MEGFNEQERSGIAEKYAELQGEVPEETDASTETEETTDDSTETEAEDTDASTETDDAEFTSEAEDTTEKTVPYGALHEEREKRKSLSKKVTELETQLNTVLQDYKTLVTEKETDDTADLDPELAALKREIKELREFKNSMTEERQKSTAEKQQQEVMDSVNKTDAELEKEGFPGFIFATEAVAQEIRNLVKEDPENSWMFSPEGWKKVFKEKVFPEMRSKFVKVHKDELFDKKKDLKAGQKIAGKTGKVPATPKKDDGSNWNYDDYIKHRKATQLL